MFRLLAATLLLAGLLPGQNKFDLADVHPSAVGTEGNEMYIAGRLELRGLTMLDLISQFYQVDSAMVTGGPAWLNTDKFDIIAKSNDPHLSDEALNTMVQTLLADRFALVVRKEDRDMPVYLLTVAKKGAKLAPAAKEGPPANNPGPTDPVMNSHRILTNYKMSDLALALPQMARNFIDHPVIDQTGLTGAYDFELAWMGRGVYNRAKANPDGPAAVGINEALDAIGLKLDPARRPQPVLVVESVNETPTPNAPGLVIPKPDYPTEFDVAEVRPAKTAPPANSGPWGNMNFRRGAVEIMGATLKAIIATSFDEDFPRIVGPKWLDEDRFDIIAKAPTDGHEIPFDALQAMLKNLVVQRFQLQTHKEDQAINVFVLLAGKKPKLKPSDGTARSECKPVIRGDQQLNGILACQNTTMAQFAERLPNYAGSYIRPPLLDLTELKGAYDFEISWTAKKFLPGQKDAPPVNGSAPAQSAAPQGDLTVFEALDQQLGLKAMEQKHPVPVLVIDKASQKPSDQ